MQEFKWERYGSKKALSHKYFHLIADDDNIEKIIRS